MESKRLRLQAIGLLVGFGIQFLAGMLLNLFITVPNNHPGSAGNEYFIRSSHSLIWTLSGGGGVLLAIHVYIALLLLLGCISLMVRAVTGHSKLWTWPAILATVFTLGALFNGLSFVDYNKDISSMIMASCWLAAVAALLIGVIQPSKIPALRKAH